MNRQMNKRPAILGGPPKFASKVNLVKPTPVDADELREQIREMLEHGQLSKGRHLLAFEEALKDHLGVRHAIAVSSATTGLMLTYQALGLKGEVVVPSFTFMATVSAMQWLGARPQFAEVDQRTTNLDAAAADAAVTGTTSAIVAVHNHGNPADIDELQAVADRHGLPLVFDAAHAFGSLYQGARIGSQGIASVFSLSPTKLLVAGECGVVATNDDQLAEHVRMGREYGNDGHYDSLFPGLNGRLPEFSALLGNHNLLALESSAVHRNQLARVYEQLLGHLPGLAFQTVRPGNRNSYKDFSIVVDPDAFGLTRDELALFLEAENIETRKYYDPPVHLQAAYRKFAPAAGALPKTELLSARSLSLPMWSNLETSVVSEICGAINSAHELAADIKNAIGQTDLATEAAG